MGIIRSSLDGDAIAEIGNNLGEGLGKTHLAVITALPVLVTALSQRASKDNGEALSDALERGHDGELLRDASTFFAAGEFTDGDRILDHVLGEKRSSATRAIANSSGMAEGKTERLLEMLAPVMLGAVGKMKKARQFDASVLTEVLVDEGKEIDKQLPGVISVVGEFLDKDGDDESELTRLISQGRNNLKNFI